MIDLALDHVDLARVLERLHPDVSFANDVLRVDKPQHCSQRFDLR